MKIPPEALIPRAKLTKYLLVWQRKSDKSKYLARAGFTLENPDELEKAIRRLVTKNEAIYDGHNERHGTFYLVIGKLIGPFSALHVITVWIWKRSMSSFAS